MRKDLAVGKAEAVPDEFATAMQQLSAEAEKTLPPDEIEQHDHFSGKKPGTRAPRLFRVKRPHPDC